MAGFRPKRGYIRRMVSGKDNQRSTLFTKKQLGTIVFIAILIATMFGAFMIIYPYLHPIILAAVFATIFYPVHKYIFKHVKERKNVAAAISCSLVALIVIVPLSTFSTVLIIKGGNAYEQLERWLENDGLVKEMSKWGVSFDPDFQAMKQEEYEVKEGETIEQIAGNLDSDPDWIYAVNDELSKDSEPEEGQDIFVPTGKIQYKEPQLAADEKPTWKQRIGKEVIHLLNSLDIDPQRLQKDLLKFSSSAFGMVAERTFKIAGKGVGIVISFFLMIFVMYYFFRDGPKILGYLLELSPLHPEHEKLLIQRIKGVTKSAVLGTVLTAIVQGVLAMIAFAIVGIPWFFWGVVLGFASLIPVVGTALVWVPCCLFLLATGSPWAALGLAVWCIVVVGFSDNLLRPMLMQGDTGMSSIIAFFAILGGIQCFGLIGVIYGPLIFGLAAMLLYIFKLETNSKTDEQSSKKTKRRRRRPKPDDRPQEA